MHDSTQSAWAVNTRIWLVSWKTLISYNYIDSCLCCSILEYAQYYRDITDQYTKTLHFMPNSKMICNLRQIELCTHKWEKDPMFTLHACMFRGCNHQTNSAMQSWLDGVSMMKLVWPYKRGRQTGVRKWWWDDRAVQSHMIQTQQRSNWNYQK